jgi:hypothetical protein
VAKQAPRGRKRASGSSTLIRNSRALPSEEKALYHNVLGAGRRGTLRKFFDISREDQEVLAKAAEQAVALRLGKL